MADKPILFSAPMIRALLDGRKTQTRRVLKLKVCGGRQMPVPAEAPPEYARRYGICLAAPGDRLWVREAWRARLYDQDVPPREIDPITQIHYIADGQPSETDDGTNWNRYRHARFMPRWASRLTLTVTDVRVQRLQEISEADAVAEGLEPIRYEWWQGFVRHADGSRGMMETCNADGPPPDDFEHPEKQVYERSARDGFRDLWNSLHGPDAWDANPWVCALTFVVAPYNIDLMTERAA